MGRCKSAVVGRGGALAALLLAVAWTGARADERGALFLTPTGGPLGEVAEALIARLAAVQMAGSVVPELPEALPVEKVVVATDAAVADSQVAERLLGWVREGGGVVLLVEPSEDHYAQATAFLLPLGAQVSAIPAGGDNTLVLGNNPITGGLSLARPVSARMKISGPGVRALARAGSDTALAQIPVEKGGIIVLPASLLVSAMRQRPPEEAPLTIGQRAVLWVNRPTQTPPPTTPAGKPATLPPVPGLPPLAPTSLPLETVDFAGAVLYDCQAADDSWPEINDLVQGLLQAQGVEMKALQVQPGASSLVVALRSEPLLAVLGTWRKLSEAETVAVYYYLLGGGRILALGNASTATQVRLTYLNEALNPLGVMFTLGRPGGTTAMPASPLREVLKGPANLPPGIRVTGDNAVAALTVGPSAALTTARRGRGRLVALDARPLLESADYRTALGEGIKWLLSTEN